MSIILLRRTRLLQNIQQFQNLSLSTCATSQSWRNTRALPAPSYQDEGEESHQQQNQNETLITIPVALKHRLEKKRLRESTEGHRRMKIVEASRLGDVTKVLIHCKRKEFNFYRGQTYGKGAVVPLASKGWHHNKSRDDWFTIRNSNSGPFGFNAGPESSFEDLGVGEKLVERLKENKAFKPTLIQELAIPAIMKGGHSVIAAETGCGKTLAYLIPLVQQLLLEKRRRRKRGFNQPLAIIVLPSHELASQIYYVCTKMTEGLGLSVKLLQGGSLGGQIMSPPTEEMDLMISTVHALSVLTTTGVYHINRVQHLVLDEADTLLDDSFSDQMIEFLARFPLKSGGPRETQLSLVSATMPRSVEETLTEVVPIDSLNYISTPDLHFVMSHVPQTFLRLRKMDKPTKLTEIVQASTKDKVPLMIFCNKTKTVDWMHIHLKQEGIPCEAVHGSMRPGLRKGRLDSYQNGHVDILISTDLGSRGINTIRTGHVLNYEFPMFTADYIHRCGRTGRVGSLIPGKVTNFISRKSEIDAVKEIELSVRTESSISKVDANIKRQISRRYGMYKPITGEDEGSDSDSD